MRLRYILKGIMFLSRRFPKQIITILLFSIPLGVVPALSAWIGKVIVDDVVIRLKSPDALADISDLGLWIGAAALMSLLAILMRWRQSVSQDWLQRAGTVEIDRILIERTQAIDVLTRESPEFADRQMLVQMGSGALSANLVMSAVNIGQTIITMASFTALLVVFSPFLTLLAVTMGVSFGVIEMRYSKKRHLLTRALVKLRRKLSVTRSLLTNPRIAHEIQRPDTYDNLKHRVLEQGFKVRDDEHKLERATHLNRTIVGSVNVLVSFGVYALLIWQTLKDVITFGDVMLYRSAFSTVSGGVQALGRSASALLQSDLQLAHLFEFLDHPSEGKVVEHGGHLPFPSELSQGFELRDMFFQYPNMDYPVFNGLDLTLRPGRITVITGPNGTGKTTLLKIIGGVYRPTAGRLELEGEELASYVRDQYIDNVYMWGITSAVHPLMVRENIALCRFLEKGDDDALMNAAEKAGALDIIQSLPAGLDTMLTRVLDDGQQLSWGQSSRVILARALFARARVILIDEPGAGLDWESRENLLSAVKSLCEERIVVIASHDPAVIAIADDIIELGHP